MSSFINKNSSKLEFTQPRITTSNTSRADDIGIQQNLLLDAPRQRLEFPLIARTQLSLFLLELYQLGEFGVSVGVCDLSVKGEE